MKRVSEIMTPAPHCRSKDTPIGDIARLMVECSCGSIPLYQDEESRLLVGIVTDRDIVCRALAQGRNALELVAADCMSQPVITIHEDATIDQCAETMERHRIRRLPVVDANGRCVGIVATADVVDAVTQAQVAELMREVSVRTRAPAAVK